jgi:uncharacterized membrane protein YfcA
MIYLIYPLLGIFVGFLSGLFGIGGGLVLVPSLALSFTLLGVKASLVTHMAISTSMSIILFTVARSAWIHNQREKIDRTISAKLIVFIVVGALAGAVLMSKLPAWYLKLFFCIYVVLVSIKMWMEVKIDREPRETSLLLYGVVGFIIGLKSTLLGIGGGTISTPFLAWRGVTMKKAIGISAFLGVPIALVGASYGVLSGILIPDLPKYSAGLVYLPALIGVVCTSFFSAQVGVKYSHILPQQKMKKYFAVFLFVVAIKTTYSLFA